MSYGAIGRGVNSGPASDLFPLSGATASSPAILVTATTAAAQTVAHTCDANALDMPYIVISNVSAASITVYGQIGSTATTGNRQFAVAGGAFTTAYSYDVGMSKSGIFGFWSTATAGLYVTGVVSRVYTATA